MIRKSYFILMDEEQNINFYLIFLFLRAVSKFLKSALKTPKSSNDDSSHLTKSSATPLTVPSRPSPVQQCINHSVSIMSKSMSLTSPDATPMTSSDYASESLTSKTSMSASLYNTALSTTNSSQESNNNHSTESIGSSTPSVLTRSGKVPIGTRVLPVLETHGETPPVRLRHFQAEKKGNEKTSVIIS